jgi:tRNA pseudouridine38-40 synthase
MPTWKLIIEYEGTRYSGWQEQKNSRTVAGELRQAAERFFGQQVEIAGAGRTDAGVHALGQVVRMISRKAAKPQDLTRGLNDELPADINILSTEQVSPRFDPRRDAITRYYLYQISTRRTAFAKRFVWWVKDPLDLAAIGEAVGLLAGRRDFSSFSERRGDEKSTIVVVNHAEIGMAGDLMLFRIAASHFLWKMVRRLVGTLVEVGRGNISVVSFRGLLDRVSDPKSIKPYSVAAHTAPPSGLFLERVVYEPEARRPDLAPAFHVRKYIDD